MEIKLTRARQETRTTNLAAMLMLCVSRSATPGVVCREPAGGALYRRAGRGEGCAGVDSRGLGASFLGGPPCPRPATRGARVIRCHSAVWNFSSTPDSVISIAGKAALAVRKIATF